MIDQFGLIKGRIEETIVTTYNEDGSPNSAPMGVMSDGKEKIILRMYRSTDTLKNILREGCFVVNIISKPMLFLKAALLGRNKAGDEIEITEVGKSGVVAPYLREASAYVEVELVSYSFYTKVDEMGEGELCLIEGRVKQIRILRSFPEALNRGICVVIEMSIELSRGRYENVERYLKIVKKCLSGDEYREIYSFVERYIRNSD
ncbi:hypothetical protein BMS3Bbin15_00461 [archaeon BMS3Bbin15]|nr:hypothetical protein BMS3Bbin15_00461 [archaeon BMS3Bbin15]